MTTPKKTLELVHEELSEGQIIFEELPVTLTFLQQDTKLQVVTCCLPACLNFIYV